MCVAKNVVVSDLTSEVKVKVCIIAAARLLVYVNILHYSTLLFIETQNIGTFIVSPWIVATPPSLATSVILYVAMSNRAELKNIELNN